MTNGRNVVARKKKSVNIKARQIIELAIQDGYSYDEIATICEVSVGSVKRWMSTGRADPNNIRNIELKVRGTYLNFKTVGDIIKDIYKDRQYRYRLKRTQLKNIAGRTSLHASFIQQLTDYLRDDGYFMLETMVDDEDIFIIIKERQVLYHVKDFLDRSSIKSYYSGVAEKIPEPEKGEDDDV